MRKPEALQRGFTCFSQISEMILGTAGFLYFEYIFLIVCFTLSQYSIKTLKFILFNKASFLLRASCQVLYYPHGALIQSGHGWHNC